MRKLVSGQPIPVGTPDGRGPLAAGLSSVPVGAAYVYGSERPDLFVTAGNFSADPGLFLYKWTGTGPNGEPVFGERRKVTVEGGHGVGTIFQTEDGVIHGLWLDGGALRHTVYDRDRHAFVNAVAVRLSGFPNFSGSQIAAIPNGDGSLEFIVSVSDGTSWRPEGDHRSEAYRPYDAAGIWRGSFTYSTLYGVTMPKLLQEPRGLARRVATTDREALYGYGGFAVVDLGTGTARDLIGGTRFGNLIYYANQAEVGVDFSAKRFVVDAHGITMRHPIIGGAATSYPNPQTDHWSDLIVGGEGALYYYRFTGKFSEHGAPVYADPVPVLEESALLYPGSLPVPHVIDWDGDGIVDIVAGNSEGRVLFFKNIGTNEEPAFANGVPVQAAGRDIHVQAGYSGSVQGPGEARWGYTSPAAFDWNGDGLPDILMGDITGDYTVYINRGTAANPRLDEARPLYLDGLNLHGTWRAKPGVARIGERVAFIALDGDDELHLYWRLDDYNVVDGGKLRLDTGQTIRANFLPAGGTGRLKINYVDWDLDGRLDLVLGTPRHGSVPDPEFGLPQALGLPGAAVLFLKNVGTNEEPVFRFPQLMAFRGKPIFLGQHAAGPAVADFGNPNGPDLIVGDQEGRIWYYSREDITLENVLVVRFGTGNAKLPVSQQFRPEIRIVPSAEHVHRVVLRLDNQVLYDGNTVPRDLEIDTRNLSDGTHTLQITVVDTLGNRVSDSLDLPVDNTWQMRDDLLPPLASGWLGSVDRAKTYERSSGWEYATDHPDQFAGDDSRLVLRGSGYEFLAWKVSNLRSFTVTAYATEETMVDHLKFEVSADGHEWQEVTQVSVESFPLPGSWTGVTVTGQVPRDVTAQFLRLSADVGLISEGLQLGWVEFLGRQ